MSVRGLVNRAKQARRLLLIDRCDIVRRVVTDVGDGTFTVTDSTVLYSQACQIKQAGARELEWAARMAVKVEWIVSLADGTQVQVGDRIEVNGQSLSVTYVLADASLSSRVRAWCVEVV